MTSRTWGKPRWILGRRIANFVRTFRMKHLDPLGYGRNRTTGG
jgi:hypothetical protein